MFAEFVVFRQRQDEQADLQTALAWQVAALSRQKRLPSLKTLLAKRAAGKPKARQTPQQMKAVLQALGFKGRPVSEETKKSLKSIRVN